MSESQKYQHSSRSRRRRSPLRTGVATEPSLVKEIARISRRTPGPTNPESRSVWINGDTDFTDAQFEYFRDIAKNNAGIKIADFKRVMVLRRVKKRLAALSMTSINDYCNYLDSDNSGVELRKLINTLSTNKTSFFRESHHFDHFATEVVRKHIATANAEQSPELDVWSAGCSTGQEPWSIAMTIDSALQGSTSLAWNIYATDISTDALDIAKEGVYPSAETDDVPTYSRRRYFQDVDGDSARQSICSVLREKVSYGHVNLNAPWPAISPKSAIFCRNVIIYFDKETQRTLINRFANVLRPNGFLYCGHSESLHNITDRFEPIGRSIYRKLS